MAQAPSVVVNQFAEFPKSISRSPKRNRSNNAVSPTSVWLNLVLNDEEVDPSAKTSNYSPENVNVSRHKPPATGTQITTPYVFRPVHPGEPPPHGESSRSPGRHNTSSSSSSLLNSVYTTGHQLSEEQAVKVVEVLGEILEEIKAHVRQTIINSRDNDYKIPPTFIIELNHLFSETSLPVAKPPPITTLDHLRSELRDYHPSVPSSSAAHFYHNALGLYCQMTAFLSVAQMFFEVVVVDFLCERGCDQEYQQSTIKAFMEIFKDEDNFLAASSTDNEYGLDAFMWYYREIIRAQPDHLYDISHRLHVFSILFTTPDSIESILSIFYTKYFLSVFSKEQKDHGQFYTPREVMRFMWNRVLRGKDYRENPTWIERLLRGPANTFNRTFHPNHYESGFRPNVPKILDPCMGVGSFLCEFINRLTLAAQQLPSVWDEPDALSHLLESLTLNVWGIEIDSFALHLCKLNVILHLLPIYKRFLERSPPNPRLKLERLHLFCNDTLNLYLPEPGHDWELEKLSLLRSPDRLKFDYIVTNPPYMIRKTGFISEPDSELFDERVLGKGGMQAYAYFFWFCVERCHEEDGEICLISASQWMGLEFADKLRAWLWQRCHLVEFFQFEPFKVWRKIQTDSLIFRLRRRKEPIPVNHIMASPQPPPSFVSVENPILFLRYMNRKATLQETLQAYANFDVHSPSHFDKDMHYKITPPYPNTLLPSSTNSYSFTFLMPTSAVSAYLHSITANLPSLCDHSSLKSTWNEQNPLIWHRGPNTNPVYALVVRTAWAHDRFGPDVCRKWLKPVFYWNGKNGGKEAEFWQKMGDDLRLEKKESSPAEAYVPLGGSSLGVAAQEGDQRDKSVYSLIMVDRDAVEKVRKDATDVIEAIEGGKEFWDYLREARKYLQTGMTSREIVYCGTSKCGVGVSKIIHPINYGYFSKNQPRQRFFIDENNVCVTNQCIYFTLKTTTQLPPHFFLGLLNSTTIQHFLSHHCKYDQQGRMRLFRESMAKIPYAAPNDPDGISWFVKCVDQMIQVRKMLFSGIRMCDEEDKVGSAVVEKLRRGGWQLNGREWQEKERDIDCDEASVVLREEQEGNWVMVKKCRGRGDGVEYSLYPEAQRFDELTDHTATIRDESPPAESVNVDEHQTLGRCNTNKTRVMKPFFESLLHASACLQYAIDQYVYSLYGIDPTFQTALEEDLKLEIFEVITSNFPRWNSAGAGASSSTHPGANTNNGESKGKVPEWNERLTREVETGIAEGQNVLRQKGMTTTFANRGV